MTHLNSEHFRVFRGAMSLLREPYEMVSHTIFSAHGGWRRFNRLSWIIEKGGDAERLQKPPPIRKEGMIDEKQRWKERSSMVFGD